jgi:hypothetical protein
MQTTWVRVGVFVVASIVVFALLPELAGEMPLAANITCPSDVGGVHIEGDAWCKTDGFDQAFSCGADGCAYNAHAAGTISHVFTMGLSPIIALGSALAPLCNKGSSVSPLSRKGAWQDFLIILGCLFVALGMSGLAKIGAKRQRPCFYYGRQAETEAATLPEEEFVSFFSGERASRAVNACSGTAAVHTDTTQHTQHTRTVTCALLPRTSARRRCHHRIRHFHRRPLPCQDPRPPVGLPGPPLGARRRLADGAGGRGVCLARRPAARDRLHALDD